MKRIILAVALSAFAMTSAMAASCESTAMGKDGKPLAGAAKTSYMKKCKEEVQGRSARKKCKEEVQGRSARKKCKEEVQGRSARKKCKEEVQGRSARKKCKEEACAGKAMSKDGKPLAGAAKDSFMKKCENDA